MTSVPPGARVSISAEELGRTPLELKLPSDTSPWVEMSIEHDGFRFADKHQLDLTSGDLRLVWNPVASRWHRTRIGELTLDSGPSNPPPVEQVDHSFDTTCAEVDRARMVVSAAKERRDAARGRVTGADWDRMRATAPDRDEVIREEAAAQEDLRLAVQSLKTAKITLKELLASYPECEASNDSDDDR